MWVLAVISKMYANAGYDIEIFVKAGCDVIGVCECHRVVYEYCLWYFSGVNASYDVIEMFVNAGCDVIGVCVKGRKMYEY